MKGIFQRLLELDDEAVCRILTFVMAETLEAHRDIVDALGVQFGSDMRRWWSPDQAFFDLLRDKPSINAMVRELAGDMTADAHAKSTAKVQKKIMADCLDGTRTSKATDWMPRYMEFPMGSYGENSTA
jgi:ParB family transcriptional regulator, chromosome partitioning protein